MLTAQYDAVVIAAPIEVPPQQQPSSSDSHQGSPAPFHLTLEPPSSFQTTVSTYVTGVLQPGYFNVSSLPFQSVFLTDGADAPFSSVSLTRINQTNVYKVR
ncbi:MAG: hypothetical protein WDW38_003999 [Sanguina aurantia]